MHKAIIEKLVHGGQGLAHDSNGATVFIWNALPGEEVTYEILNKKHGVVEALATEIHTPSPHRRPPQEDFYLSTAPWQIMDFSYENEMKKAIALETYQHLGKLSIENIEVRTLGITNHYRNKMEYSFYFDDEGKWHIGFFNRGSHRKRATGTSVLAHPAINVVAEGVIEAIRHAEIPPKTLKSMILRVNEKSEVVLGIFVKDEYIAASIPKEEISALQYLTGYKIYYSRPQSPASTTDKLLHEEGNCEIITFIHNSPLTYGLMSFFQVHEPVFEVALHEIESYIEEASEIVDYFSGVGAIGIPLHAKVKSATLVESNEEAVMYAQKNIALNGLKNSYTAVCTPAEKATEYITADKTIIFDPPRAGLHKDTIEKVLKEKPKKIIYMSCNIATHARDLDMLSEAYEVDSLKIYNFFPQTPHIEGLAVLNLK